MIYDFERCAMSAARKLVPKLVANPSGLYAVQGRLKTRSRSFPLDLIPILDNKDKLLARQFVIAPVLFEQSRRQLAIISRLVWRTRLPWLVGERLSNGYCKKFALLFLRRKSK
jgi:hypothetical protein